MGSINQDFSLISGRVQRALGISPDELNPLIASFATFFLVLCAYYVVRPLRETVGVTLGPGGLQAAFVTVFIVMLLAVPAFGWLATRLARNVLLPVCYVFFIVVLAAFWAAFQATDNNRAIALTFFVWASVFNLFIVSLFWSLMSEAWSSGEAKRLFGIIAAGGSAGALTGPLLARVLSEFVAPENLLLISAMLLASAALVSSAVRRRRAETLDSGPAALPSSNIWSGAIDVMRVPHLRYIAIFVLLANIVGTFFYLEQSRLVEQAFATTQERLIFFSERDLAVSVLTLAVQLFGTSSIIRRFGMKTALLALPVSAMLSVAALHSMPLLAVAAAVMIIERVTAFALANPAMKISYTVVSDDQKYRAQNFIDTVVYRGGDALSGKIFNAASQGAGFTAATTALVALPLAVLWIFVALKLGSGVERLTRNTTEPVG